MLSGNSIQLVVNGGSAPYTFEIGNQLGPIINGTISIGSLSYLYTPIINGVYYFILIDDLGCISDTIFYNVDFIPTGGEDLIVEDLQVYPNPSRDVFNITFSSSYKQLVKVKILNTIGETVYIESLEGFIGRYEREINLEDYSKSIYFLEIQTAHGIINKKLILQ